MIVALGLCVYACVMFIEQLLVSDCVFWSAVCVCVARCVGSSLRRRLVSALSAAARPSAVHYCANGV